MSRPWIAIAKAEFQVLTSSFKKHRLLTTGALSVIGVIWAAVIAPIVVGGFINAIIPMSEIRLMLMVMFPGLMRTVMMFLWFMLLLFPMSYALQEIKIGQWEIFLSNNVKTRDILSGTFLGKIPLYGLVVLFLAPVIITPFVLAFEISLFGQAFIYGTIVVMVLATVWLSNWLTSMIQARLGDSAKGNDIAKAVSMVVAIIVIFPMYGLMMFAPTVSEILTMDVFLFMPFTWYADLISWLAIGNNGIGLTASQVIGFENIISMDILTSALVVGAFVVVCTGIGLYSADRIFTIDAGIRTETVTTITKENFLLRGIRRVSPGPFGALVVVNLKDFLRKAQNLSKIGYGIILATILPFFMSQMGDYYESVTEMLMFIGPMLSICGVFPFAGQGFLESKDQLWIIQGSPSGASRFIRSRLASAFLICIPLAVIPISVISFIFGTTLGEFIFLLVFGYLAVCGAAMVAIGITARNPNYEDSKSPAHQTNIISAMLIAEFSQMGFLIGVIFLDIFSGIDLGSILESLFGVVLAEVIFGLSGVAILGMLGAGFVYSGIRSLSRPE